MKRKWFGSFAASAATINSQSLAPNVKRSKVNKKSHIALPLRTRVKSIECIWHAKSGSQRKEERWREREREKTRETGRVRGKCTYPLQPQPQRHTSTPNEGNSKCEILIRHFTQIESMCCGYTDQEWFKAIAHAPHVMFYIEFNGDGDITLLLPVQCSTTMFGCPCHWLRRGVYRFCNFTSFVWRTTISQRPGIYECDFQRERI